MVFTLAIFIGALFSLLFGLIAQKMNKILLIIFYSLIGIIMPLFIFKSYIKHEYVYTLIFFSCAVIGGVWGVIPSLIAEFFPTKIRYSGIATCYNLAFAVLGGLAPTICLFLIKTTGKLFSPAYYLMALAGFVLLLSLFLVGKQLSGSLKPNRNF